MVHHVTVGALRSDAGVLMARRRAELEHAPGLWSFPGGHIEPGETAAEALSRELREELGVTVVVEGEPHLYVSDGETFTNGLVISLWVIARWSGEPTNAAPDENDEVRWMRAGDLADAELAHWTCRTILEEFASLD